MRVACSGHEEGMAPEQLVLLRPVQLEAHIISHVAGQREVGGVGENAARLVVGGHDDDGVDLPARHPALRFLPGGSLGELGDLGRARQERERLPAPAGEGFVHHLHADPGLVGKAEGNEPHGHQRAEEQHKEQGRRAHQLQKLLHEHMPQHPHHLGILLLKPTRDSAMARTSSENRIRIQERFSAMPVPL